MIQVDMGESIKFIQTAVTRLSSIIDALLRLSRAGRVEYRYQMVEVRPIIDRVVAALRGTIDERNASVIIGELSQVWGDPTAVEQVFANLIGNAVNYLDKSRPGVIEIFVVDHDPSMTPSQVVFAVRDNGLGISEQYRSKIFNAFQRLHGDVAKGEGVGLALVQRMVERHGGRVWFESQAGVGTTFFVAFPGDGTDTEVPESMLEAISPDRENRSIQNGRS
jgi:signal transduction histidine kinase